MNTAWNRWCRNLPSGTALSLYDNRITPIIITDITGRRNVRIQNSYTCTTSSGLDSGAFLLTTTELFERANQTVACPITGAAHWRPSACEDANW